MPRKRKYRIPTQKEIESAGRALVMLFVMGVGIFCIISFTNWLNNTLEVPIETTCNMAVFAILAIIIGTPIAVVIIQNKVIERKYKSLRIANIDLMDGVEFERYLQKLLINQGYSVRMTNASGDLGVDLVASRNNDKIAIQAKCYKTKISRRAISDAVAGMNHYGCSKAMVITNNYFSPGAIALAKSTNCILVDRDTLANWVNQFQKTSVETA